MGSSCDSEDLMGTAEGPDAGDAPSLVAIEIKEDEEESASGKLMYSRISAYHGKPSSITDGRRGNVTSS